MFEQKIDIEKASSILKLISEKYQPDSEEYKMLELAGLALHYALEEKSNDKFHKWLESVNKGLSEKQKNHLRSMGINPESSELF
ncbi:MAG TPA: hypothetical protein DCX54_08805 [Flavobacteriales bacterium]|nr:hypothetical protein [Flavobacteriales bacterium]